MHLLTIIFGPTPTPWALLFQKSETAELTFHELRKAWETKKEFIEIFDDFGQTINLVISSLHGFMLEDMEKSKLAHIERGLHQARTQARAQQMAVADPILKAAALGQGPAILQPMGNGRFPS